MHLLTPILSVLGFLLFERNRKMNICWSLLPVSSVFIYAIYYLIQLFIHDSFGKSEYDWYGFTTSPIPWPVFLLVMIGAGYLVSLVFFLCIWIPCEEREDQSLIIICDNAI